ncbi:AraC family transcriptional regulator [uncultured Dokdonia sp.]|uniref:AraC family transcriptional regulator n=1 Tax=uncultured Dokdonia sp. TaxID=575653 RepID=UPI0026042201|nr:AraC family transcriptional regulator [uncultured Dokdonia sp.]
MIEGLKLISFENQKKPFPLHFHTEYCISLIRDGVEVIETKDETCYGHPNDITITHPYELHANPLYSATNSLTFDTFYISSILFEKNTPFKTLIYFTNRLIKNQEVTNDFLTLKNEFVSGNKQTIQQATHTFITTLIKSTDCTQGYIPAVPLQHWDAIENYIQDHIKSPLRLEDLASVATINKYSFARNFKKSTGLTPINYVLMKKVFDAKSHMTKHSILKDIAYDYNFVDIAHFSKFFKRFVGISPKMYCENFT